MIKKFEELAFSFFHIHSVIPTYWFVHGKGFSEKYTKFTQKKLLNLSKKKYVDKDAQIIQSLGFCVTTASSDAPAYDAFCNFDIGYEEYKSELKVSLLIDLNYISINKIKLAELINQMSDLFEVDFGYVYFHENYSHVEAVVEEVDDDKFSEEEYNKFLKWYRYTNDEKLKNIRDVYPINILNRKYFSDVIDELSEVNGLKVQRLESDILICLAKNDYVKYL